MGCVGNKFFLARNFLNVIDNIQAGQKGRKVTMRETKQIFVMMVALGFFLIPVVALAQQHAINPAEVGEKASKVIAEQKININTATVEQFQNLPGIGSSIAQEIINYRHEHGPFQKVEDIMQVKGIGEKKFEKIKDLITVGEAK